MSESVKNSPHMRDVGELLKGWTDNRIISAADIQTWYRFIEYLVNLAEADGWVYDGHSFTVRLPMSMLVVRGTIDGIPHVVFSSGRTTTHCMRAFLRKMDEGWLEWQVDRYRG